MSRIDDVKLHIEELENNLSRNEATIKDFEETTNRLAPNHMKQKSSQIQTEISKEKIRLVNLRRVCGNTEPYIAGYIPSNQDWGELRLDIIRVPQKDQWRIYEDALPGNKDLKNLTSTTGRLWQPFRSDDERIRRYILEQYGTLTPEN